MTTRLVGKGFGKFYFGQVVDDKSGVNERPLGEAIHFKTLDRHSYFSGLAEVWRLGVEIKEPTLLPVDADAKLVVRLCQVCAPDPYNLPSLHGNTLSVLSLCGRSQEYPSS